MLPQQQGRAGITESQRLGLGLLLLLLQAADCAVQVGVTVGCVLSCCCGCLLLACVRRSACASASATM
jgi:hypothetical protein